MTLYVIKCWQEHVTNDEAQMRTDTLQTTLKLNRFCQVMFVFSLVIADDKQNN